MSFTATGTATDPFSVVATAPAVIPAGGATGTSTVRRTFFETRVNWDNSSTDVIQGPDLVASDPFNQQAPVGPVTLGHTFTVMRACNIVGTRIFKHPSDVGAAIPVKMWDDAGVELASTTVNWSVDAGGWREITWSSPVSVVADDIINIGIFHAGVDTHYAVSQYVWNNFQDTCVYPFLMQTYEGGAVKTGGSWNKQVGGGGTITFSNAAADRWPANYYIDPIAEWTTDLPVYTGPTYWDQWTNGPDYSARIPIAVWWPNASRIAEYAPLGINTIIGDYGSNEDYVTAIKAAALEWWPFLHDGDMTAPVVVAEDSALASLVTGYFITDEPDVVRPYNSPTTVEGWRDTCRRLDSTRPHWLNLSRYAFENQGFTWQPTGITAKDANLQWREYAALSDIGSTDAYSINATYPYNANVSPASYNRYGIWCYPLQVQWARDVTDNRCPVWGVVETASSMPGLPLAEDVKKATWALLIAGADGIEYFQHRFADADQANDFASMLTDPLISAGVTALNAQIQSLAGPLIAPEANLVTSVASSNTTAGPIGAVYGVPIHYTSRQSAGLNYVFCQGIRPGATTATFTIPSAASKTITVIGESRTLSPNGSGVFTDTFAADYSYHLYRWTP